MIIFTLITKECANINLLENENGSYIPVLGILAIFMIIAFVIIGVMMRHKEEGEKVVCARSENVLIENETIENDILENDVYKRFCYLKTHITQKPTDSDWEDLYSMTKERFPNLSKTLTEHPHINEKDMRICLLTRMHFTPKEICNILDLKKSNVSNTRKRLLKKIFNEDGSSKSFDMLIRRMN